VRDFRARISRLHAADRAAFSGPAHQKQSLTTACATNRWHALQFLTGSLQLYATRLSLPIILPKISSLVP
jgi:hypothetical protein